MTETEIMKALERCVSCTTSEACDGCPLNTKEGCDTHPLLLESLALDLINSKNAEIDRLTEIEEAHHKQNGELRKEVERLNAKIEVYKNNLEAMKTTLLNSAKEERAVAIRMYAERLKTVYSGLSGMIDYIAKEMGVEL